MCRVAHVSRAISFHINFAPSGWLARNADFHSKANEELMWEVLGRIEAILSVECT